jgi:aspartate carbamoyltransferase catalytic subunit
MSRHLLDIGHCPTTDLEALIKRGAALSAGASCACRRGTIANLFFEPSTRTRVSFEMAALRLGLQVVTIDQSGSSTRKGESLADTGRTLSAMGVKAIVLRHAEDHAAAELAEALKGTPTGVINAGDGQHAHPSQALLDAVALHRAGFDDWSRMRIAIVGDIRHSRVARSDVALFERLGVAEIRLAGPKSFLPDAAEMPAARRFDEIDEAIEGADAVICLRIQRERIEHTGHPDGESFHREWGLTEARAASMAPHARILHPGPVNRDIELSASLVDDPRSLILEQVRSGIQVRTAIFEWSIDADG